MSFAPTDEQLHIQELFRTGEPLLVRAGAGTGKTTTLEQLAVILNEQGRKGLYVAFNKSIATEAGRRFPGNVTASTAHSLAYRGLRATEHAPLLDKLRSGKIPFSVTAHELGIKPVTVTDSAGTARSLSGYQITRHVLRTVDEFCKTTDTEIGAHHVPPMIGLDAPGKSSNNAALTDRVLPLARKAWANLLDPKGTAVKFGHGHYLKLWALTDPTVGPDGAALFLDEAQDTSPVLAGVLARQEHLQRVYVGDSAQAIYRFTGARDAMAGFSGIPEAQLTRSWRFGPAIAEAANHMLADLGDCMRLTGNDALTSVVTDYCDTADAVLARTNGTALEHVMAAQNAGKRVHLMGDQQYALRFCDGAERLQSGQSAGHEDLAAFSSWGQVQDHAQDSPDSADWKTLVALIDNHGVWAVKTALSRVTPEKSSEVIVATAHKAKGREWERVRLADDMVDHLEEAREKIEDGDREGRDTLRDEQMLCYVAVTRAKSVLVPGGVVPSTGPAVADTAKADPFGITVAFTTAETEKIREAAATEDPAEWVRQRVLSEFA